jgi:hypothetical protein
LSDEEIEMLKEIYANVMIQDYYPVEEKFNIYTDKTLEEDIYYIINNFFKKEKEVGIDIDFIFKIAKNYSKYEDVVREKVDELAKTFKF